MEAENEELASKLTDLTTQAKKMLLNNEQLEEEIQDQQVNPKIQISVIALDVMPTWQILTPNSVSLSYSVLPNQR